jgi:nitroreductase
MALVALEHGVGSCWVSRFEVGRLVRLLGLRPGHMPSEILAFGYPAQANKPAEKKRLDEVVFYNYHGHE